MQVYQVGRMFSEDQTHWPEGSHLWMDDSVRLGLFLNNMVPEEVDAVFTGEPKFAWLDEPRCGYLAFKFGTGMNWSDAPFNPHRQTTAAFAIDHMPAGTHRLVMVFLVDADTGILRAMRATSWPAHFMNAVRRTVNRLANEPYHEVATAAAQDQHWAQYRNGTLLGQLVRARAVATCKGGTGEPA